MPRLASRQHGRRRRRWLDAAEGADFGQDQPGHRHRLHRQPLRQVDTKLLRTRQRECMLQSSRAACYIICDSMLEFIHKAWCLPLSFRTKRNCVAEWNNNKANTSFRYVNGSKL